MAFQRQGSSTLLQQRRPNVIYCQLKSLCNRKNCRQTLAILKEKPERSPSTRWKSSSNLVKKRNPGVNCKNVRVSDVCCVLNEDSDLTLLQNLDQVLNFPIKSFIPALLDEGDALEADRVKSIKIKQEPQMVLSEFVPDVAYVVDVVESNQTKEVKPRRKRRLHLATNNNMHPKPSLTYPQLIEACLKENEPVTVTDIYSWISTRYPYFNPNDGGWKNAIRHNLSMQVQFRKGKKLFGKSHVWHLDYNCRKERLARKRNRVTSNTLKVKTSRSNDEENRFVSEYRSSENSGNSSTLYYVPPYTSPSGYVELSHEDCKLTAFPYEESEEKPPAIEQVQDVCEAKPYSYFGNTIFESGRINNGFVGSTSGFGGCDAYSTMSNLSEEYIVPLEVHQRDETNVELLKALNAIVNDDNTSW